MRTTPDNEKLLDLVDDGRKGKIVLPQFQRNFVWSRDDITALLISILEGHFIGSFLLLLDVRLNFVNKIKSGIPTTLWWISTASTHK